MASLLGRTYHLVGAFCILLSNTAVVLRLLVAVLLFNHLALNGQAQSFVQLGSDHNFSAVPGPFSTSSAQARSQYLLTRAELMQAGLQPGRITAIAFEVGSKGDRPVRQFQLGYVARSQLFTGTAFVAAPFSTVFTGTVEPQLGWFTLSLQQPIIWDGSTDLILQTCFADSTTGRSTQLYHTNTFQTSSLWAGVNVPVNDPCTNLTQPDAIGLDRPNLRLYAVRNAWNDAAVVSIDAPQATCAGPQPVVVTIRNEGINPIDSVQLNWAIDGIVQPPVVVRQRLDTLFGQQPADTTVTLGQMSVTQTPQRLRVWVSQVNGAGDPVPDNDVQEKDIQAAWQGQITVDPTGGDFTTIQGAIDSLAALGVCGPVTVDIADGQYQEQLRLTPIPGTSVANQIHFRSASMDSSRVRISHAASDFTDDYVLQWAGADYVTFSHLTFQAVDPNFGLVVSYERGTRSTHNRLVHCHLRSSTDISFSTRFAGINSESADKSYNSYDSCQFTSMSVGVQALRSVDTGFAIRHSHFTTFARGIDLDGGTAIEIKGNVIAQARNFNSFQGITLGGQDGGIVVTGNTIDGRGLGGLFLENQNHGPGNRGLIANNEILCGGLFQAQGIRVAGDLAFVDFVHNTVHCPAGLTGTPFSLISDPATAVRIANNIFSAPAGVVVYRQQSTDTLSYFDYNLFDGTQGVVASIGGANATDLVSLQALSGGNANSLVALPQYRNSLTDLRPTALTINNAGTPWPGIPSDLAGHPRDTLHPDMGAYEFDGLPIDIMPLAIQAPDNFSCDVFDSTRVTVQLYNNGIQAISDFTVSYGIFAVTLATEQVADTILSGDTLTYTFTQRVDISTPTLYPFKAWSSVVGDANTGNDSVLFHPVFVDEVVRNFPYIEDFDDPGGSVPDGWLNDPFDAEDWLFDNGVFPGLADPNIPNDHTSGQGHFAWMEDNAPNSQKVSLMTPCLDLQGMNHPVMEFYYFQNFFSSGNDLVVDVWVEGAWIENYADALTGVSQEWSFQSVDLTPFVGKTIRLRFRAIDNNVGFNSDIGIDDIKIYNLGPVNLGASALLSPISDCAKTDVETVEVAFIQFGTDTLPVGTSIPVAYQVDGGLVYKETAVLTQPAAPGDTIHYTFFNVADLSQFNGYDIAFWSDLPTDDDFTNDTLRVRVYNGLVTAFPYREDFSTFTVANNATGFDNFWRPDPGLTTTNFRWNVNQGPTETTFTGPAGDHTTGNGKYIYVESTQGSVGASATVLTPCFDLSNVAQPGLNFYFHSTGLTMSSLHVDAQVNGVWFDDIIPPIRGDFGDRWLLVEVSLLPFQGSVVTLRFRSTRSGSGFSDIAIDDILIGEMPIFSLGDTVKGCGSALVQAGIPAAAYQWSTGQTSPSVQVFGSRTATTQQQLTLTATSTDGLQFTDSTIVLLAPGPVFDFPDDTLVCDRDTFWLTTDNPQADHLWSNGATGDTLPVAEAGQYAVTVTQQNCVRTDSIAITFDETPSATFTYDRLNGSTLVRFTATLGADSYWWDFGNGFSSNLAKPTLTFNRGDRNYTVRLIVTGICGSDTAVQAVSTFPVGVRPERLTGWQITPNPASSQIVVRGPMDEPQTAFYTLRNMLGEALRKGQVLDAAGQGMILSIAHLPAGLYFLEVDAGEDRIVLSWVKQ